MVFVKLYHWYFMYFTYMVSRKDSNMYNHNQQVINATNVVLCLNLSYSEISSKVKRNKIAEME